MCEFPVSCTVYNIFPYFPCVYVGCTFWNKQFDDKWLKQLKKKKTRIFVWLSYESSLWTLNLHYGAKKV